MGEVGRVEIVAELRGRHTALQRCSSSGLLAARATPFGVVLVAQAAHPIGDDRVEVELVVRAGASLTVTAVGASLARLGASSASARPGEMTTFVAHAVVEEGATLCWEPEPTIVAAGARYSARARLDLDDGASITWREEAVLGRFGEPATGTWRSLLDCRYAGAPLVVSELALGPGDPSWAAPSVLGGRRAVSSLLSGGGRGRGPAPAAVLDGRTAAVALELAGPGRAYVAAGDDLGACRSAIASLLAC